MTTNATQAIRHLELLAAELETRHFAVRILAPHGLAPRLNVINIAAPVLTEKVLAAPDSEGTWNFYFPWPERPEVIAPVQDIPAAADRVERVLAEVGR